MQFMHLRVRRNIMLGIVMHPHLPFSSLYLHGIGALFVGTGVISLVLGQTHGASESRTLQSLVARLRAQLAELEDLEHRATREWKLVAEKLTVAPKWFVYQS